MAENTARPVYLDTFAGGAPARLWLRPLGLLIGAAAAAAVDRGLAWPLAGGRQAFTLVEALAPLPSGEVGAAVASVPRLRAWAAERGPAFGARIESQIAAIGAARADWAGLPLDRPLVMGIVNVTPDSFSDGGQFADPEDAVAHGRALLAAGADILDVGGESTRPGAAPVAPDEEWRRIGPVVAALASAGAVVSVDTRRAPVMAQALAQGARIVNDVSALTADRDSLAVVARADAPVVLMHMRGEPGTMQDDPRYALASFEVTEYLAGRVAACEAAGLPQAKIVVDPGIGFGKRSRHNLDVMSRLTLLHALGCGVLLGVSRKSLVGEIGGAKAPKERLPGSLAGALHGLGQGVQIFRVHDVAETRQAVALWRAMNEQD